MGNNNDSSFDDFVKNKTEKKDTIDWKARKDLWLFKIDELYSEITGWINRDEINISTTGTVAITEDYIGSYNAPMMKIKIGDEKIELIPKGTLIIGGRGRIDARGSAGEAMLILMGKNDSPGVTVKVFTSDEEAQKDRDERNEKARNKPQPTAEDLIWRYASRTPRLNYHDLDKSLFEEIVMRLSRN